MAHARRYFDKALDNDKQRAEYFLAAMQTLYSIERRAKDDNLSAKGVKELRQQEALPVLQDLKTWLQENYAQVLPKSPIGKAIAYSLPRWDRLSLYTSDGRLQLDNNTIENAIRPVAIGRKNFLFAGSNEGGKRLALFYSLLLSCKKQDVNPWEYLKDILERMPTTKTSQLRELLPDRWKPQL
jgi:hypothetical protein